jgi:hypothetical protein
MGERRPCKAEAVGSIPISSTGRVGCTMFDQWLDIVDPARSSGSLWEFFDNCIRVTGSLKSAFGGDDVSGQATKGVRWMPWRKQAKKDVASCEKLRGAAKQALIRRSPNGATRCR